MARTNQGPFNSDRRDPVVKWLDRLLMKFVWKTRPKVQEYWARPRWPVPERGKKYIVTHRGLWNMQRESILIFLFEKDDHYWWNKGWPIYKPDIVSIVACPDHYITFFKTDCAMYDKYPGKIGPGSGV